MAAPPGSDVSLDFSVTLSPPSGGSVTLNFDNAFIFGPSQVGGWQNDSAVGAHTVALKSQWLRPLGIAPTEFLNPFWARGLTIYIDIPHIYPASINDGVVNSPTYVRWRQYLYPSGFQPTAQNTVEQVPVPVFRYLGGYIPPPGGPNLIVNFSEPLVPPPGGAIVLEFGAFGAGNILGVTLGNLTAYGTHFVSLGGTVIRPTPWVSSTVGTPDTAGNVRTIFLSGLGIAPPGMGSGHDVSARARALLPGGVAPPSQTDPTNGNRQIPNPMIDFRIRYIRPSGYVNTTYGTPDVSRDIRYLDLSSKGIASMVFGTQTVTLGNRTVAPLGFASFNPGSTTVKRIWKVDPIGWLDTQFSDNAELVINTRRIYVLTGSADQAEYGIAWVFNYITRVTVPGINAGAGGISSPVEKIYNSNQHVQVAPYAENIDPTGWTNFYPFVENKKRYIGTFGHVDSRFPLNHWIHNGAEPLFPVGTDMTVWGPETFIAYKNREVGGQGWDSFYNTIYTVVFNAARVIAPPSLGDTSNFGRPDPVLNLNRTVTQHSGWVGAIWGDPFIAYRVRSVVQRPFNDVPWPLHEIRLNPFPISPAGIPWQGQVGGHEVTIFRREALPKSVNVHSVPWVGEPIVENRNKSYQHFGNDTSLYGKPDIQNYIRYILPTSFNVEGLDAFLFGSHLIERRTKNVNPVTIAAPAIVVTHRIKNQIPDPPAQQLIDLNHYDENGIPIGGNGIAPPSMGSVVIRLATIYPFGIDASPTWGQARVYTNNLLPRTIFEDGLFGTPVLIYTQIVAAQSVPRTDNVPSGIRMSPWNIYAPGGDATPPNYTPIELQRHLIGARTGSWDGSAYPWFGRTEVTNQHRAIGPVPQRGGDPSGSVGFDFFPKFGTSSFTLRRQYVYPQGIRSLRFGQIIFWGVPQYVNFDDEYNHQGIANVQQWGAHRVHYPDVDPDGRRYAYPVGWNSNVYGTARVELLNREVLPQGIPHRGNPQQGLTSPWGTPLVGYPRTYVIGMGVQTLFGTHVIEFLNRPVYPVGWINCSLEVFNLDDFRFPMKVTRVNPKVGAQSLGMVTVFGNCSVSQINRSIYARGIDGYNSGTHLVKATRTIGLDGWLSSEFGDIDRWEAGKIKAHGDDLSTVGTPHLLHPLRPSGILDDVVAAPRISPSLRPTSWQDSPWHFQGPSITNPFGCTNRVITPLPVLSVQVVPSPVVTRGP